MDRRNKVKRFLNGIVFFFCYLFLKILKSGKDDNKKEKEDCNDTSEII